MSVYQHHINDGLQGPGDKVMAGGKYGLAGCSTATLLLALVVMHHSSISSVGYQQGHVNRRAFIRIWCTSSLLLCWRPFQAVFYPPAACC
jgi:hypothetical protein